MYFWLCWVFVVQTFPSCGELGCSLGVVCGLLVVVASPVVSTGSRVHRLQQLQHVASVVWLLGSRAQAP